MIDREEIDALHQETAKLQHEFNQLQQQISGDEWFEVVRRDLRDALVRRQNELQAHIRLSNQIIAERK